MQQLRPWPLRLLGRCGMSTHLHLVADTTPALPLVPTGALVHARDGLRVEVVPDGQRVADQATALVRWLRANNTAMSRLWSAVLNPRDEATTARAVLALSAFLLDTQHLELTPDQADELANALTHEAHVARTIDPALPTGGDPR